MIDVSIIIPFYKNVEWLYQSVNSIDEDKLNYEIIIINDGCFEEIDLNKIKHKHTNHLKVIKIKIKVLVSQEMKVFLLQKGNIFHF
ncbi:glycosyltransferase [Exiguobacterium sp. JMULE1]|uniref:glycosyltransferase n=1 Tax=Exiguobacterium sp. JMULE1 TaxID=2518339 RepID=UPI0020C71C60|nr:glycosyltransferase [Exiguobacterium sp. JMULE1]